MQTVESLIQKKFKHDFRITRGSSGVEYRVKCPFCTTKDRNYKLYINIDKGVYHCFRCEATGGIAEIVAIPEGTTKATEPPVDLKPTEIVSPGKVKSLTELDADNDAIKYIISRYRKWDIKELNDTFSIRYCYEGRTFAGGLFNTTNTLIIPVIMDSKIKGWQSRLLYNPDTLSIEQCEQYKYIKDSDGEFIRPPKYFTAPGLRKGDVLFNFDQAKKNSTVVITEGVFDAMSVGSSAVAIFGKSISDNQLRLIKSYWTTAIIMLDPDDADQQSFKMAEVLKMALKCVIVVKLKGYKDPGDAPRAEIWKQIQNTVEGNNLKNIINIPISTN